MTFGGIWACQWRELRPIVFGGGAGTSNLQSGSQRQIDHDVVGSGPSNSTEGGFFQQSLGPSRGRGRGRNFHDGGGEYEMVRMKEEAANTEVV